MSIALFHRTFEIGTVPENNDIIKRFRNALFASLNSLGTYQNLWLASDIHLPDPQYEDEIQIAFSYNQMLFQQDHDEL